MMKTMFLGAMTVVAAFASSPLSAQIINLPSVDTSTPDYAPAPVTQTFGPGTYDIHVIGKAQGGQYDPYSFATPAEGNYGADYTYTIDGQSTRVSPFNGQRFPDAQSALDAYSGVVSSFTLDKPTDVTFSLPDTWYYDNIGGLSLGVTSGTAAPVPEPGTLAVFGIGAGGLLAMRRRKRASAA